MEITCKRDDLIRSVATVERAAAGGSSQPVLTGILIEARGGLIEEAPRLQLTCTDLNIGIETVCPAQVHAPGLVLLDAKYFGGIVRKLPGEEVKLELDTDDSSKQRRLVIRSGKSEFKVAVLDPTEFPALPEVQADTEFVLSQGTLRQMIRQTAFATIPDESRPFLSGALVEIEAGKIRMVGTDNARLAFREADVQERAVLVERPATDEETTGRLAAADGSEVRDGGSETGIDANNPVPAFLKPVVPAGSLQEIARLCENPDQPAVLKYDSRHFTVTLDGTRLVSGLIHNKYPDYNRVLLRTADTVVAINREELLGAVERAMLVGGKKGTFYISLDMNGSQVALAGTNQDVGEIHEELEAEHQGPPVAANYNPKFLADMLKVANVEKIEFLLNDPGKQSIVRPAGDSSYTYVVMPVSV